VERSIPRPAPRPARHRRQRLDRRSALHEPAGYSAASPLAARVFEAGSSLIRGGAPAVLGRTAGSSADANRSARYSRPQGRRWPTVTTCRGRGRDVARHDALRRPLSRSAADARDLIRPRPRRCSRSTRGHPRSDRLACWPRFRVHSRITKRRSRSSRAYHSPRAVVFQAVNGGPSGAVSLGEPAAVRIRGGQAGGTFWLRRNTFAGS
jgi:hypothetical protein